MNMKSLIVFVVCLLLIVAAWLSMGARHRMPAPQPSDIIVQSTSTSTVKNLDGSIEIETPQPNSLTTSPLKIMGQARGTWYFEAQFPIELMDAHGQVIATGAAHATSDWMTSNFVPFTAELTFTIPTSTPTGLLIFKKDNPSGDPAKDLMFAIPVRFR